MERIFNLLSFGIFASQKEHNIGLKESSNEDSQISSNDENSSNNNIKSNFSLGLTAGSNSR